MDQRTLATRIEAVRAEPEQQAPWLELGAAMARAGTRPDLGRALSLVDHLVRHLAGEPRRSELRQVLLGLLGLEPASRGPGRLSWWSRERRLGHDSLGHFDLVSGFPLFARLSVLDLELSWIPAGRALLGAEDRFALPRRVAALTRGFFLGRFPVRDEVFQLVAGRAAGPATGAELPARAVSWTQAAAFCAALTRDAREVGRCPATWAFQLPSEVEWEYAARAQGGKGPSRHPFGLEDLGNQVLEWCQDAWHEPGPGGTELGQDPWWEAGADARVLRGSGVDQGRRYGSRLFRRPCPADQALPDSGFRLCFQARQPVPVTAGAVGDPQAPAEEAGGLLAGLRRWLGFD